MKKILYWLLPALLLTTVFACKKLITIWKMEKYSPPVCGVVLCANGPGNTYELIDSVLGGNAEEVPDCSHPAFGRHISEIYDSTLHRYVFAFFIHVHPANDGC